MMIAAIRPFILTGFFLGGIAFGQVRIDRKSLVTRHNIDIQKIDTLASLTIGNGAFAYTVDVTGLQSFPQYYGKGVPLGTQSEWGWHSWPNEGYYRPEETWKMHPNSGRDLPYSVQWNKQDERRRGAADYFRQNLHRLQLGNVGLEIFKEDGSRAGMADIEAVHQAMDLWTGAIHSRFSVEGVPVEVLTYAHQEQDAIAVKIISRLVAAGRIRVFIKLPYPTGQFADAGTNYNDKDRHRSELEDLKTGSARIRHVLDSTTYFIQLKWQDKATLRKEGAHYFVLEPANGETFSCSALFTPGKHGSAGRPAVTEAPGFAATAASSMAGWKKFWMSGGAVDLSGSTDPRAFELERRIILSQYLTRVQCAGHNPPQETGLTYNSWYGKPHMEMFWWHAAHFALWNRTELLEKSMDWYFRAAPGARQIAQRQGFDGIRWQKMTDNDGRESPSSVGALLIWEQPHLIYLAELVYRNRKSREVLKKYKDLVFATADFMANFPTLDKIRDRYNLGPALIPAQECFNADSTFNPTFELSYWYWALGVAQDWRTRLGLPRVKKWDSVLEKLAPLPLNKGVYLAAESVPDGYAADSKYTIDHPAVLAALGMLPAVHGLDTAAMRRTYELIGKVWHWDHTWGWDFPMMAMTATRLGQPGAAMDALFKEVHTNTWLVNGHNYQDGRLTIYLPGNGALLTAVALMCAGYDGAKTADPGFPKDGTWQLRWEGLRPMPGAPPHSKTQDVQLRRIVVDPTGGGDFKTIQAAVNSVRDLSQQRVTIFIRRGIYHEKVVVPSWKTHIAFLGEDRDSTIITNDDYSGKPGFITFNSYTVLVEGNDFTAENLTIRNTAGRVGQAVALHVEGDRVVIKNCRLLGNQDTLYAATGNSRQYYEDCYIEGTTDFIFGEATVIFKRCVIKSLINSFITAASTTPGQSVGFVFIDCRLVADSGVNKVYLGRPWRPWAKTVFIHCELGAHILAAGWDPWKGDAMFPEKERTTFYSEYGNTGPGSAMKGRVGWAKIMNATSAKTYTMQQVLGGQDHWDPIPTR